MHDLKLNAHFEQSYRIVSHQKFLQRKGLGNEVPFFIDTYHPEQELPVQRQINILATRLETEGIPVARLPMYKVVIDMLKREGRLEAIFAYEKKQPKYGVRRSFLREMEKFTDPTGGKRLQKEIFRCLEEVPERKLVFMYQLGTIYPFLRTHTLLNNLHSVITSMPLLAFFPGEYVSSERDGFYLSLFGKFKGDYYRAFQLRDYIERGQIRADVE